MRELHVTAAPAWPWPDPSNEEIRRLKAENAKLRELVKRMYAAFQRVFPEGHRLDFEADMRELGVEVDG